MKHILKITAISVAVSLVFLSSFLVNPLARVSGGQRGVLTVCIDAGHGGIDGGVTGVNTNVKESELNLDIALKLEKNLNSHGIKTVMTRTGEGGLYGLATKGFKKRDMLKRKEIINSSGASAVISIHLNKCSYPSRRGAQVFYRSDSEAGKQYACILQEKLNLFCGVKNYSALVGDYYILNCTPTPSVICECGFLSNAQDEKLLILEEYRESLAYVLFEGTISFLLEKGFITK